MRRHVSIVGVSIVIIAVIFWVVGLWVHVSNPFTVETVVDGTFMSYPEGAAQWPEPPKLPGCPDPAIRSDIPVHLMFTSNCSTNIYLEHVVSPIRLESINIASNVTFLDTRFIAKEKFGVRSQIFVFDFEPVSLPAIMEILIQYEIPDNFYMLFMVIGIWFAALGFGQIVYSFFKKGD